MEVCETDICDNSPFTPINVIVHFEQEVIKLCRLTVSIGIVSSEVFLVLTL